jgi:hypothetical protein
MAEGLSATQDGILKVIVDYHARAGGILSADAIGRLLSPRVGRLGATSALRALERKGLAVRIPPRDQWATAKWSPSTAARQALTQEQI